jgi:hypothetical protein
MMWHTSELVIWRSGSESERKCLWHADSCINSRLQTLLGISESTLGTIECQIIRTKMCQIISKTTLVLAAVPPESGEGEHLVLTPAQTRLRKMVLDAVASPHSKRNYARALDDLFAFCASRPLSRELLMEWRAGMESLSPSTINVRLSAVRKMVGEARHAGMVRSCVAVRCESAGALHRATHNRNH